MCTEMHTNIGVSVYVNACMGMYVALWMYMCMSICMSIYIYIYVRVCVHSFQAAIFCRLETMAFTTGWEKNIRPLVRKDKLK